MSRDHLYRPERALAEALASEARWLKGRPIGPLDGAAGDVKDNIATRGDPKPLWRRGKRHDAGTRRRAAAARLREAGADLLLPRPPCPTTACCPRASRAIMRLRATPGSSTAIRASSAGGGAAAAALPTDRSTFGTDIGGSIRLPAGWCGIFAEAERRPRADRPRPISAAPPAQ